jgi:hypothetical protein
MAEGRVPHGQYLHITSWETLACLPMAFQNQVFIDGCYPADPWEDFLKKKKFPKSAGQAFSLFMAVFPDNDAGESKSCLICYFL